MYSLSLETKLILILLRLAVERAKTAKSAVEIIGELVEKYGQGGTCYDPTSDFSSGYDNSFLVVDDEEAWVVETCDHVWVAKQIKGKYIILISKKIVVLFLEGYYHISNIYGIEDDYTLHSNNLESFAKQNNLWDGKEKLNFSETFQDSSPCTHGRLNSGKKLLENLTKNGNFSVFDMISILRDDQSGICMLGGNDGYTSTGSQVSVLIPKNKKKSHIDACHFFTGTPNPKVSLFKPFIFSNKVELGPLTVSSPSEITSQRVHPLYSAHKKATQEQLEDQRLKDFEHNGIMEVIGILKSSDDNNADTYETLFHDTVAAEIELLREHPSTKRT
jgi:secernin